MFPNRTNELIEQQLALLPLQCMVACQAHAAIHSTTDVTSEVRGIAEEVTTVARHILSHDSVCDGGKCAFHTQLDQLICRADRLLRDDRDLALRPVQLPSRQPALNNQAYGHVAAVESFVAVVKSLAYYSLSSALNCPAAAPTAT